MNDNYFYRHEKNAFLGDGSRTLRHVHTTLRFRMNSLLHVPITAINALTPEQAVDVIRCLLRAECGYAKAGPQSLTISKRLTIADGGIDAETSLDSSLTVPNDCIFKSGLTGFQIKSGTSFKPWTRSAIRSELIDKSGNLFPEVDRLIQKKGRYTLIATGHDFTPEQRNKSKKAILDAFVSVGVTGYDDLVEVLGASQLAEFFERYPGTASLLSPDPVQEALVLDEWRQDSHMGNIFEANSAQEEAIQKIRLHVNSNTKHVRVLGEPGLGKTRLVLEAVKDPAIASFVIYIEHGTQFDTTNLFRQLLKSPCSKPLVLVIDELPEKDMSDIWRNLKTRCGFLKIISIDHGHDETRDEEITRIAAPKLSDETIKQILVSRAGELPGIERWIEICDGSPRVAQAVGDNLRANPGDVLKSPSTVPIWDRFLHGYGLRNEVSIRQVDCVTQHLALFKKFGYEDPIASEAVYIASLVERVDPTIGWARFQEIIRDLRKRRVIQGSKTLLFVPRALHLHLWRMFWKNYGRNFDFVETFSEMPETLHVWFMSMFKYSGEANVHIVNDILERDGIFSNPKNISSEKGSKFISILAEASPASVLKLLESTVGKWSDDELLGLDTSRQNIVWALEKVAVWPTFTVRAIKVLSKLAVNETAKNSNNASGTLIGLFRIGPEAVATEASPQQRLPAMISLLRGSEAERRLALKAMSAALDNRGTGIRVVGPEYQGLRERAKLWAPATYQDWWDAQLAYFRILVEETRNWTTLRLESSHALLDAVDQHIKTPPCTELAFDVLKILLSASEVEPKKINSFFYHQRDFGEHDINTSRRLQRLERKYVRRNIASRFRRYVLDVEWLEWEKSIRNKRSKKANHAKPLVAALARRIAKSPEKFEEIRNLLAPEFHSPAMSYFGEQLAFNDSERKLVAPLVEVALETKHYGCLQAYLNPFRKTEFNYFRVELVKLLSCQTTAWIGASLALSHSYEENFFELCLEAYDKQWIEPSVFGYLRFGESIKSLPANKLVELFNRLEKSDSQLALPLLMELFYSIPFDAKLPFTVGFLFSILSRALILEDQNQMQMHYWKEVCKKFLHWSPSHAMLILDMLLKAMKEDYSLSYDFVVSVLATEIVANDPVNSWEVISKHFEECLPKWRSDLLAWLKGGINSDSSGKHAITFLPIEKVLSWVDKDVNTRAALIAHAAPRTLDDQFGGALTRALLERYENIESVKNGISAHFHSGSWTGLTSVHFRGKREMLREWLSAGFNVAVIRWIDDEIEYLDKAIAREEMKEERSQFD